MLHLLYELDVGLIDGDTHGARRDLLAEFTVRVLMEKILVWIVDALREGYAKCRLSHARNELAAAAEVSAEVSADDEGRERKCQDAGIGITKW